MLLKFSDLLIEDDDFKPKDIAKENKKVEEKIKLDPPSNKTMAQSYE